MSWDGLRSIALLEKSDSRNKHLKNPIDPVDFATVKVIQIRHGFLHSQKR